MQMSDDLKRAFDQSSQAVIPEISSGRDNAEVVAEMAMGYMLVQHPAAWEELTLLTVKYGYPAVLEESAKHVRVG